MFISYIVGFIILMLYWFDALAALLVGTWCSFGLVMGRAVHTHKKDKMSFAPAGRSSDWMRYTKYIPLLLLDEPILNVKSNIVAFSYIYLKQALLVNVFNEGDHYKRHLRFTTLRQQTNRQKRVKRLRYRQDRIEGNICSSIWYSLILFH